MDNIDPELLKDLDEEIMKNVDIDKALKKLTKDMTFGEALVAGYYYYHKKDPEMMIKCYERALTVGGKQALMKRLTMELAEAYLIQKDYEKSQKHANVYVTLYPGDQGAKKAAFLEIKANYLGSYTPDRDQQKTEETIKLIEAFKINYGLDEEYNEKINEILHNSYEKLINSELSIAKTYTDRYKHFNNFSALNAAQKRTKKAKELLSLIGGENKRLNEMELYIEKNMRFELSKIVIDQAPTTAKSDEYTVADLPAEPLSQEISEQSNLNLDNQATSPQSIDVSL